MEKDYLVKKWLNDDLTEAERMEFERMEESKLDRRILEEAKRFKASQFSETPKFAELEDRLRTQTAMPKKAWLRPLVAIAAALVVGVGLYSLLFLNASTNVQTLASEKATITLPDASEVTLNAFSELSFNESKWSNKREVNLEGEAFFKVAKGETFDVLTSQGTVTVIGTQFNVKERPDFFEVVCYEGVVAVKLGERIQQLTAGAGLRLVNDEVQLSTTVYTLPQWTKNVSDFRGVPFHEVIAELERQYAIELSYPEEKSTLLFTGGFVHDSLENALLSITQPLNLNYIIESSSQVTLSNSE